MQFVVQKVAEPTGREAMQERLTRLCGVNEFDEPLLRLEWGGTAERWLAGAWRAKYRAPSTSISKRLVAWIEQHVLTGAQNLHPATSRAPVPAKDHLMLPLIEQVEQADACWYLAEWIPPEKLGCSPVAWEQERWQKDAAGKPLDVLGPFPARGQYRGIVRLAGPQGEFIEADDARVFAYCEALWSMRQQLAATKGHWREFMSPAEVNQAARDVWDGIQADHDEQYAALKESIASDVAPHAHRVLGNPRVFLS